MKKIVGILAGAAVLASSVFAADFAARTYMTGDIANGDKDGNFNVWKLNATDQKDSDALIVSVNGDNSGAKFQFWYNYSGDEDALKVRGANVWFKPMDMLKVTIGSVSEGTYKEMIHWWKDPIGTSVSSSRSWDGKYSSYSSVEGHGIVAALTPVDGLDIVAGIAAGTNKNFISIAKDTDTAVAAYGASVKYNLAGPTGLPITAAVSWRDNGTKGRKVLAIGADYGNNWSDGFYGFVNARMLFEGDDGLKGVALDNYFKYGTGAFKAMARVPVIIRTSGKDDDPSYLEYEVKVQYALDACTIYAIVASDLDNAGEIAFNAFGDDFKAQIKPGVQFNVGSCALDIAAKLNVAKDAFSWSVPFEASVSF